MRGEWIRGALMVLGAVSVGLWCAWLMLPIAIRAVGVGKVRAGSEARLHSVLDPVLISTPMLIGALVAGLLVGYVSSSRFWYWVVAAIVTYLGIGFWPVVTSGNVFVDNAGLVVGAQAVLASALILSGVAVGRRLRGSRAVA